MALASTTSRWKTKPPSPTWRPSTARPAASSRSTQETIELPPAPTGRRPSAWRWWRPMPRRRACGRAGHGRTPVFTDSLELELVDSRPPSIAGPKRPQDRMILLDDAAAAPSRSALDKEFGRPWTRAHAAASRVDGKEPSHRPRQRGDRRHHLLHQHLEPQRADRSRPARPQRGRKRLKRQAVGEDHARPRLAGRHRLPEQGRPAEALDAVGFNLVGYGCTTCIGNSGPLPEEISAAISTGDLVACSVLSGNRNFEGRVNPDVRANYLASPPLVVAYALAGSMNVELTDRRDRLSTTRTSPSSCRTSGRRTRRSPTRARQVVTRTMFATRYFRRLQGRRAMAGESRSPGGAHLRMGAITSTYVQNPPLFRRHDDDACAARPT